MIGFRSVILPDGTKAIEGKETVEVSTFTYWEGNTIVKVIKALDSREIVCKRIDKNKYDLNSQGQIENLKF